MNLFYSVGGDNTSDDGDSDSDDEEKAIYNPKNLPLGWDGKPIPYWLYKLHGGAHVSFSIVRA